jgi:hypothetical protein
MPQRQGEWEISALYLELASECFDKSTNAKDAGTSEAMRRMGHSYVAWAVSLDPSLDPRQPELTGKVGGLRSPMGHSPNDIKICDC